MQLKGERVDRRTERLGGADGSNGGGTANDDNHVSTDNEPNSRNHSNPSAKRRRLQKSSSSNQRNMSRSQRKGDAREGRNRGRRCTKHTINTNHIKKKHHIIISDSDNGNEQGFSASWGWRVTKRIQPTVLENEEDSSFGESGDNHDLNCDLDSDAGLPEI